MPLDKKRLYRDYVFTCYNLEPNWLKEIDSEYICWGDEVCPETGRPHLQGFISLSHEMNFEEIQSLLSPPEETLAERAKAKKAKWKPIHFEPRKGSVEQAIHYTKGDGLFTKKNRGKGTKVYKPLNLIWYEQGIRPAEDDPKEQGKRNDMEYAREMVKQGMSLREFAEVCRSHQALKLYRELLVIYEVPRLTKPFVLWLWGDTKAQKSNHAYRVMASKGMYIEDKSFHIQDLGSDRWEGYDGQKGIYIDEFVDTKWDYKFILKLLKEPLKVNMKYGSRDIQAEIIIISANKPAKECYSWLHEERNGIEHLLGRIDDEYYHPPINALKTSGPRLHVYDGIPCEVHETQETFIPRKPKENDSQACSVNPDACD